MRKDGQMDMTKAMGTFYNYVNAPKQVNGSSKSKILSFIIQHVLFLVISYSYFGGVMNKTLISIKMET
jgi:hypothetical protein